MEWRRQHRLIRQLRPAGGLVRRGVAAVLLHFMHGAAPRLSPLRLDDLQRRLQIRRCAARLAGGGDTPPHNSGPITAAMALTACVDTVSGTLRRSSASARHRPQQRRAVRLGCGRPAVLPHRLHRESTVQPVRSAAPCEGIAAETARPTGPVGRNSAHKFWLRPTRPAGVGDGCAWGS